MSLSADIFDRRSERKENLFFRNVDHFQVLKRSLN